MSSSSLSRPSAVWTTLFVASSATAISYLLFQWFDHHHHHHHHHNNNINKRRTTDKGSNDEGSFPPSAHEQLIQGGTPLIQLKRLSLLIRRNIHVKMESLNPSGTGKDRAAWSMIQKAEMEGRLPSSSSSSSSLPSFSPCTVDEKGESTESEWLDHELSLQASVDWTRRSKEVKMAETAAAADVDNTTTRTIGKEMIPLDQTTATIQNMIVEARTRSRTGGLVVEGTSGSTGIALANLCAVRGHACIVVVPDDQAQEKQIILKSLGALVYVVPTAAISNPNHYVNVARKVATLAREEFHMDAIFTDQFENDANFDIHYHQTGPEIWEQRNGKVDAFVMSSGTGGTIAGVGTYLKEKKPSVQVVLVDPPGSALYHKIEHGIAYAVEQRERTLKKHRYDTLAEGIGLDRVTQNFARGLDSIDRSFRVTDQEAVDMAHWMLQNEGLWIGSSSAMNMVGAIRTALELPEGSNVVTMICDAGQRHATRFWNPRFIESWGLQWPGRTCIPECLRPVLTENIS